MKRIIGRYATAIVYTDIIEENAIAQLREICDQPFAKDGKIRIMPDVHAGTDCVIGFTADIGEQVVPSLVGADIGCGVLAVELGKEPLDFVKLERVIREYINRPFPDPELLYGYAPDLPELKDMRICDKVKNTRVETSMGRLGGGNHFIEVDVDEDGIQYLVIHVGSRALGKIVMEVYQRRAWELPNIREPQRKAELQRQALIKEYISFGSESEIEQALKKIQPIIPENQILRKYHGLTGKEREDYLHDMKICQEFAAQNRKDIADTILKYWLGRGLEAFSYFDTVHNYIDPEDNIIRKGAVSAKLGERLLIPLNMRDGCLLCVGKGNAEWNCSAPHGAGRLLDQEAARRSFTVESYAEQMQGVFTKSVGEETLDECPMAYKPADRIMTGIFPTVDIVKVLRPVYNFKANTYWPVPLREIHEEHIQGVSADFKRIMRSIVDPQGGFWGGYTNVLHDGGVCFDKNWNVCAVFFKVREKGHALQMDECAVRIDRKSDFYELISKIMEAYLSEHPDETEECHELYAAMVKRFDKFEEFK